MDHKNKRFVVFILLSLIQLAIPLYMAWHWSDVRQTGQPYLWKTQSFDPNDAFRGRYINLYFSEAKGPVPLDEEVKSDQMVYARLGVNAEGFAYIESITNHKPSEGDYVRVRVLYVDKGQARVELPFTRYYMTGELAPLAETAFLREGRQSARILLKVKEGYGVVDQLYIGEQTIYEYLENHK